MNLVRITATAYVYCTLGAAAAHAFFHDLAGWLMMPLAFAALWLELAVLSRLFVAVQQGVKGQGSGAGSLKRPPSQRVRNHTPLPVLTPGP